MGWGMWSSRWRMMGLFARVVGGVYSSDYAYGLAFECPGMFKIGGFR